MEFTSKLAAEELQTRLRETTKPFRPTVFELPAWHHILYKQKKRGRFILYLQSGYFHFSYFVGELHPQEQGTLIQGSFSPIIDRNPVLSMILGIVFTAGIMVLDYLFRSQQVHFFYLAPIVTILIPALISSPISHRERGKLSEYIQNNLLQ